MPKQNFLTLEFWTKFQHVVPLILKVPELPFNTVYDRWKEAQFDSSAVSIELRLVTDTDTDRHETISSRAIIASRG